MQAYATQLGMLFGEYGIPYKHWASGAPVNFTGEYGIPYKHWASGAPVNFTREYCIPCKHRASSTPVNFTREYCIPCKHRASGAPVNFTGEYGIPCNTKYLAVQLNCTSSILSLRRSPHCTELSRVAGYNICTYPVSRQLALDFPLYRILNKLLSSLIWL